jgi:hypothetical protein
MLSNDDTIQWKRWFYGFEFGERSHASSMGTVHVTIWKVSYWSVVIPLTLLSAYFLLSKPHLTKQAAKSASPPE